jgi:hypothetical protein
MRQWAEEGPKIDRALAVAEPRGLIGHEVAEPRWRDSSAQSVELRRDLQGRDTATLLARDAEDKPAQQTGHDAAKEAVRVDQDQVRDERDAVEQRKGAIDDATREAVDRTFAKKDALPHGAEVVSESDDRLEIIRRDKQGNAIW